VKHRPAERRFDPLGRQKRQENGHQHYSSYTGRRRGGWATDRGRSLNVTSRNEQRMRDVLNLSGSGQPPSMKRKPERGRNRSKNDNKYTRYKNLYRFVTMSLSTVLPLPLSSAHQHFVAIIATPHRTLARGRPPNLLVLVRQ
jgi:hypothetical protein